MKRLKPHKVDWAQIERFLASAERKLASAHKILAFDEEACLQQAYEARCSGLHWDLCSATASGQEANPVITSPSSNSLGRELTPSTRACSPSSTASGESGMWLFMTTGFVSRHEAEEALESARNFIDVIRADITARKP